MSEQRELRRGEVRYVQDVREYTEAITPQHELIGARHEVYDGAEWIDVRRLLDAEARAQAAEAKVATVEALARDGERFPSYDPRHRITPDLLRRALDGDA